MAFLPGKAGQGSLWKGLISGDSRVFPPPGDIVCHKPPLYKLRRDGHIPSALYADMDRTWKS